MNNKQLSYKPLWITLVSKSLNKTTLREDLKLSSSVIAKMGRNEPVTLKTIVRICEFLDCDLSDVVELINK